MRCSSTDEILKISVAYVVVENVDEVEVPLDVCVSTGCIYLCIFESVLLSLPEKNIWAVRMERGRKRKKEKKRRHGPERK